MCNIKQCHPIPQRKLACTFSLIHGPAYNVCIRICKCTMCGHVKHLGDKGEGNAHKAMEEATKLIVSLVSNLTWFFIVDKCIKI